MSFSSSRMERVVAGSEGAGGFIAQQYFRIAGQRAGNRHALFLAAGEVGRVAVVLITRGRQDPAAP